MELLVTVCIVMATIGLLFSSIVYRRLKKVGKNPWPWSIAAFMAGAALAFGALYVIALFTFSR